MLNIIGFNVVKKIKCNAILTCSYNQILYGRIRKQNNPNSRCDKLSVTVYMLSILGYLLRVSFI
jgi:hypothetical protein